MHGSVWGSGSSVHGRSFSLLMQAVGRHENIVGWYHSHPGYGCWLSGIDCQTQMINQTHQEPWLAIVVDPHRTMSAGWSCDTSNSHLIAAETLALMHLDFQQDVSRGECREG
jgi:proteasome lid subunit RPN8/RPN11